MQKSPGILYSDSGLFCNGRAETNKAKHRKKINIFFLKIGAIIQNTLWNMSWDENQPRHNWCHSQALHSNRARADLLPVTPVHVRVKNPYPRPFQKIWGKINSLSHLKKHLSFSFFLPVLSHIFKFIDRIILDTKVLITSRVSLKVLWIEKQMCQFALV